MASFYDNASIITIPSGYKVGTLYSAKPTDGSGDMAFTRTGDTATRVNSAGIIERCITNLFQQSNTFTNSVSWFIENTTITGSIADPNGGTTAFSMAGTSATSNAKRISQTPFSSGSDIKTVSIYAKANTHSFLQVRLTTANIYVNFDLTSGTFSAGAGAIGTMTSLGSGWYRCQITSVSSTNTIAVIQLVNSLASISNESSTTTNSVYIWRAQAQLGNFASNYIDTTTAAVTEGPVTNLPRLDYFGSTCPQLLLEPTRTNLATYSQMFDNSVWTKPNVSVSGNVAVSPDGYSNAYLLIENTASSSHQLQRGYSWTSGTIYTQSVFAKQGTGDRRIQINLPITAFGSALYCNFNLQTGVVTTSSGSVTGKLENYGNGWYRCSATATATANNTTPSGTGTIALKQNNTADSGNYLGDGTSSMYIWGTQLEAGAYATSYIPTTAATVTRNQDLFAKASITSLLGQTEGTLFLDFTFDRQFSNADVLSINDASILNRVSIGVTASNTLTALVTSAGVDVATITSTIAVGTRYKCAIAYKLNDFVLYVNGVQAGTDTLGVVPVSLTRISNDAGTTSTTPFDYPMNQTLVFKTRLTNAELATLTTL
jgi:hypothetical protein